MGAVARQPLRVGIIGAGGIARDANVPAYRALGEQVELVAVADVVVANAERLAADAGFRSVYASYEEMLRSERLDLVSVCTPNKFHAPAVIAALEAGVAAACVKPPALTAAEARAMADAARRSGKVYTVLFPSRCSPDVQSAKRFADGGGLGEIYSGRVVAQRRRGIPSWGVFTSRELQGGGPLIDIGVHGLDAALWVMGYPQPKTVMGVTHTKLGTQPPGPAPWGPWDHTRYDVEDVCNALITFENGASLMVETSFILNTEKMDDNAQYLYGTKAGLRLSPFAVFREEHGTLVNATTPWQPRVPSYHAVVANFVRAVRGEEPVLCTPEEAVTVQTVIEGIYRSAELGRSVDLQREV